MDKQYPSKETVDALLEDVKDCLLTRGEVTFFLYRRQPGDDPEETGTDMDMELHVAPSAMEIVEAGPDDGAITCEHLVVNVEELLYVIDPTPDGDEEDLALGDIAECVMAAPCDEDHRACIVTEGFYRGFHTLVKVFLTPFPGEKGTPFRPRGR